MVSLDHRNKILPRSIHLDRNRSNVHRVPYLALPSLVGEGGDFVGSFINGVPGALTAILAFFAGWLTTARRFHVYALVLIISGVITAVTQWTPAVPFLCTGVVVQAMGTKLLYNFRRDADAFEQAA